LTWPSWLGRFVILAFPIDVSIIADFINLFPLERKGFCGVSITFLIVAFSVFFVFGLRMFASFALSRIVFMFPPWTLSCFLFVSFRVTCLSWFLLS